MLVNLQLILMKVVLGGAFEDLEFDDEEKNFPDHMLLSMKQFKILNKKLNSII